MFSSTTSTLQGHAIMKYHGVVHGEAILGTALFKDLFEGIRDIVGGRSAPYEGELTKLRKIAMDEMEQSAAELGANAVVGVDVDYEVIGQAGSMLMVTVSGTAVTTAPKI